MAKIVTYIGILIGVWLLLNLVGIQTGSKQLYEYLVGDDTSTMQLAGFIAAAAAIFGIVSVGGIIASFFGRTIPESSIVAGLCAALLTVVCADLISLITYMNGAQVCGAGTGCEWAVTAMSLLVLPLIGAFIISLIQWWRGADI